MTLPPRRLEQLHHVPRRVLAENLLAAGTRDDLVAERDASRAQVGDGLRDIAHLDDEAIPAAGFRLAAIRHRARGGRAGPRDPQCESIAREDRDVRAELLLHREAEMLRVERD